MTGVVNFRVVQLHNGITALLIEDHLGQERAKKRSSHNLLAAASTRRRFGSSTSKGSAYDSATDDSQGSWSNSSSSGDEDMGGVKGRDEKRRPTATQNDLDPDDMSVRCPVIIASCDVNS